MGAESDLRLRLQGVLDKVDVQQAFIRAHWAKQDLARYLDARPSLIQVLQVDPDPGPQFVERQVGPGASIVRVPVEAAPMTIHRDDPAADPDAVDHARRLFERDVEAARYAVLMERWYMSNPDVVHRHAPHVIAARERDGAAPLQLGPG